MLYKRTKSPNFIPEDNFSEHYANIHETISNHLVSGYSTSSDGLKIYYEYVLCENAVGNVVIVHGLSEFTKKFYEIFFFFLNQGYNVFIYDQRGHGLSERETDDLEAIYVNSYYDYVDDLTCFINNVVEKVCPLPITIFSQSMGGAITGLYLQENPNKIKKAIFSAPMVCPKMNGFPRFFIRMVASRLEKTKGKDKGFVKDQPFDANSKFEDSSCLNKNRFDLYMKFRIDEPRYRTSNITNSWMKQTTYVQGLLLRKNKCDAITTKCYILSAEDDRVVYNSKQKLLYKRLPNCKFFTIKDAKHTVYASTPKILEEYFNLISNFLAE